MNRASTQETDDETRPGETPSPLHPPHVGARRAVPLRLPSGAYFVTICTRGRECLFGKIVDGEMRLNDAGEIAQRGWEDIPRHFPLVELDAFFIMPNHVHGVIVIQGRGEASAVNLHVSKTPSKPDASPLRQRPNGTQPGSLSAFAQNFKSISTRRMNAARGSPGTPIWQRGYYEHVVRDEDELEAIREYIQGNPARWEEDENNPLRLAYGDKESPGSR